MYFLGIDPGQTEGGLVLIDERRQCISTTKMPATTADIWAWLDAIRDGTMAAIEQLGQMPRGPSGPNFNKWWGSIGAQSDPTVPEREVARLAFNAGIASLGKAKQSPTTMQKMGANRGHLEMALVARASRGGLSWESVAPAKWQREFALIMPRGTTRTAKKRRHKETAQRLFPTVRATLWNCDALLIAEWLRRREVGG